MRETQLESPVLGAHALIERYQTLLVDAYGVLVHSSGALPGAREFLAAIREAGRDFFVVTNDASNLPEAAAAGYRGRGLEVEAQQVVTSGSLLTPYFRARGLAGARCMVLGTDDSFEYVRRAGGEPSWPEEGGDFDLLVVCDQAGYPFLEMMDLTLSVLFRHFDRGRPIELLMPNPDLIYTSSETGFGYTSGAAALLFEAALGRRYPELSPKFVRLGKPFAPIFDEALRRVEGRSVAMVGDQIETDIAGANAAGIDSVLIQTGITRLAEGRQLAPELKPTYRLQNLASLVAGGEAPGT